MKSVANTEIESSDLLQFQDAEKTVYETKRVKVSKFGAAVAFAKNGACSRVLMTILDREYGHPHEIEERSSEPLAGGLMHGYQCGMIWGSTLAAGAQAYRLYGPGPQTEATVVGAAQEIVQTFRECTSHVDCLDITDTNPQNGRQVFTHFFLKGGVARCVGMASKFAPEAFTHINDALGRHSDCANCSSGNCAALLARKVGASEKHQVMASGLAGGIGFSGGGCGALGAAIWLLGIKGREEGLKNKVINSRIEGMIEKFLKTSDHEFECSEIIGRQFKNVDDHAEFVNSGGCSEIIESLADDVLIESSILN